MAVSETNAEKLHRIKNETETLWKVSPNLKWLIEQAEKVERLKKEKKMFSDWVNELQVKNSELEHRLEHKIFE